MKRSYILVLAIAALSFGCSTAEEPLKTQSLDFEVESVQSANIKSTLKQMRGKVVVLDFWASYCGPCHMLTPDIESIYQDYKNKGLTVMAISSEERPTIEQFERMRPHKLPVFVDSNRIAATAFKVSAIPHVFVLDKQGNLIYEAQGYSPTVGKEMREAIDKASI